MSKWTQKLEGWKVERNYENTGIMQDIFKINKTFKSWKKEYVVILEFYPRRNYETLETLNFTLYSSLAEYLCFNFHSDHPGTH